MKQHIVHLRSWCDREVPLLWGQTKEFVSRNRYGLMGTLAFHMILLILLLAFKLNTRREFSEAQIFVEIPQELIEEFEEIEKEKQMQDQKSELNSKESVEELLKSIAVNQNVKSASKTTPSQSVENMIEEIRKDLEGTRDEAGTAAEDEGFLQDSLQALSDLQKQKLLDSLESIEYSGPSSVYYKLDGRHKVYLPIPIYKCEGEGLVVVEIGVNRSGKVTRVRILPLESAVDDECLFEAARVAARKTRFNADNSSPVLQKGKISYNFVKQ